MEKKKILKNKCPQALAEYLTLREQFDYHGMWKSPLENAQEKQLKIDAFLRNVSKEKTLPMFLIVALFKDYRKEITESKEWRGFATKVGENIKGTSSGDIQKYFAKQITNKKALGWLQ